MHYRYFGKSTGWILPTLLLVFGSLTLSKAGPLVLPGYDLFETLSGTAFVGVPFEGVPIGTYDFGSGPQKVGTTDTIVQRFDPASAPSTTIDIELVALQLKSSVPADFGLGLGTYYITLQSARGGPASLGAMTINFDPRGEVSPHGTFDSFFDVFFDIRLGDLDGPIALSDDERVDSRQNPWSHDPPRPNACNPLREENLFPDEDVTEAGMLARHVAQMARCPDSGATCLLMIMGLSGVICLRRKLP